MALNCKHQTFFLHGRDACEKGSISPRCLHLLGV